MKMTEEHFAQLTASLDKTPLACQQATMVAYQEQQLSPKRFRWDLLHASGLRAGQTIGTPTGWNVYDYLDDDHIDTALRQYCKNRDLASASWA